MNWGAAVLLFVGGAIVVMGVTGSQQNVCTAITGKPCTWLPGPATSSDPGIPGNPNYPTQGPTNEPNAAVLLDTLVAQCSGGNVNGTSYSANTLGGGKYNCSQNATLAAKDANNSGIDPTLYVRELVQMTGLDPMHNQPATTWNGSTGGALGQSANMPASLGAAGLDPVTAKNFGIDPFNTQQALAAGSGLMSRYEKYWATQTSDPLQQEALTVSSYTYGLSNTQKAVSKYGTSNWWSGIPQNVSGLIDSILYPKVADPNWTNHQQGGN